jgi:hypothetical protein
VELIDKDVPLSEHLKEKDDPLFVDAVILN